MTQTLFFALWQTRLATSAIGHQTQLNVPKLVNRQQTNEVFFVKNWVCIDIFVMGMIKYVYSSIMCLISFIIVWKEWKNSLMIPPTAALVSSYSSYREACALLTVVVWPAHFVGKTDMFIHCFGFFFVVLLFVCVFVIQSKRQPWRWFKCRHLYVKQS